MKTTPNAMIYTRFPLVNLAFCVEETSKDEILQLLKDAKRFLETSGCSFVCVALEQFCSARHVLIEQIDARLPGGYPSSTMLHRWVTPRIPELAYAEPCGTKSEMFQYRKQWIDHMIDQVEKME